MPGKLDLVVHRTAISNGGHHAAKYARQIHNGGLPIVQLAPHLKNRTSLECLLELSQIAIPDHSLHWVRAALHEDVQLGQLIDSALQKKFSLDSKQFKLLAQLKMCYLNGETDKAIALYEDFVKRWGNTKNPRILANALSFYRMAGRRDEAHQLCIHIIQNNILPYSMLHIAWVEVIRGLCNAGDMQQAQSVISKLNKNNALSLFVIMPYVEQLVKSNQREMIIALWESIRAPKWNTPFVCFFLETFRTLNAKEQFHQMIQIVVQNQFPKLTDIMEAVYDGFWSQMITLDELRQLVGVESLIKDRIITCKMASTLIGGLCKLRQFDTAHCLYTSIDAAQLTEIVPLFMGHFNYWGFMAAARSNKETSIVLQIYQKWSKYKKYANILEGLLRLIPHRHDLLDLAIIELSKNPHLDPQFALKTVSRTLSSENTPQHSLLLVGALLRHRVISIRDLRPIFNKHKKKFKMCQHAQLIQQFHASPDLKTSLDILNNLTEN